MPDKFLTGEVTCGGGGGGWGGVAVQWVGGAIWGWGFCELG